MAKSSCSWGYDAHNGPHTWARVCDNAAGAHQSPINIETHKAVYDDALIQQPLELAVTTCEAATLVNTGHSFQVKLQSDAEVSHGPLKNKYKFVQLHMHWGREGAWGSEHMVDGQWFAGEMHVVFWNSEKYPKFEDAIQNSDGLTVLAVLVKEGQENKELAPLFQHFKEILFADAQVKLTPVNLEKLLPATRAEYYTYPGSLTTPPCNECVTWIIFKDAITVCDKQLAQCRELHCTKSTDKEQSLLQQNFRTVCPLGDRQVRKSFK